MPVICPTITAYDSHEYRQQMEQIEPFAHRVHIDLMDGKFAPTVSPSLDQVWWSDNLIADIHLMYQQPMDYLEQLLRLKPHLVIIHAEATLNYREFAAKLHAADIKAGLAILHDTSLDSVSELILAFDHVLIFSGHLGYHGGEADLNLLDKVKAVRAQHPNVEISWDGGINDQNARAFIEAGVDVLNVGGYIQNNSQPADAYAKLETSLRN